jgi:hypothetical protein
MHKTHHKSPMNGAITSIIDPTLALLAAAFPVYGSGVYVPFVVTFEFLVVGVAVTVSTSVCVIVVLNAWEVRAKAVTP